MTDPIHANFVQRIGPKWRDRVALLAVSAIGAALTLLIGGSLQQAEALRMQERLSSVTRLVVGTLNLELARTTEAVRTAGLMLESNSQLTREQFNRYMQKMVANQLSVNLMEWQPIVPASKLAQFEAAARTAGLPNFQVVQPDASGVGWAPVHGRDEYVPVLFAWPEKYRTEGLDMSFSPQRMASKLQSRAVGQPVASGAFEFMKEGMVKSGSIAVAISTTVFGVDQAAKGYLAAVVDLPTLFQSATRLADAAKFDLLVFASTTPDAAPIFAMYGDDSDLKQTTTPLRLATVAGQSATVDFARQSWKLVLYPRPTFYAAAQENGSRLAFATGFGATLLAVTILFQLQIGRRKIEEAESATSRARLAEEVMGQQLREAQRIARVGSWQLDVVGNRLVWSEALYLIHGLNPDASPPNFAESEKFFTQESWGRYSAAIDRAAKIGVPYELELEMVKPDGSHGWMLARGEAVRDASGSIVALRGTAADITARKEIERQLQEHKNHLEELVARRTQDLERARDAAQLADRTKDAFLANVSHELRTPLNAVIGLSSLAQRLGADKKLNDYLHKIEDAGKTLALIVNDLLDLSKIAAGRLELDPTTFSLRQVVEHVGSLMSYKLTEKGLRFIQRVAVDVPDVLVGDTLRLKQILLNLLSNAIKFTASGQIELRVGIDAREEARVCLSLEVEDSGIGMSADEIARMFVPFSQADASVSRKFGGTGLGLALCKRLAEMMGGEIGVVSSPGQGSTFRVKLWLGRGNVADLPPEEVVVGPAAQVCYRDAHVLVVDDQAMNREIVRELLATVGISPRMASQGREALDILEHAGVGGYDLVLMDIQMPVLDGLSATRELRGRAGFADLPVIAMTAHTMEHEKQMSMAAGMNDHIGKPFEIETFYRVLAKWMPASKIDRVVPVAQGMPVAAGFPALRGVDTHAGLARFSGIAERYRHWLREFMHDAPNFAAEIRLALSRHQPDQARKTAHAIKGRVGLLGMDELHGIAAALEAAVRNGKSTGDLLDSLHRTVLDLCAEIQAVLGDPVVAATAVVAPPDISPLEPLPDALVHMMALLDAGDGGSAAAITACLDEFADTVWESRLRQASILARRFEFAAARSVLGGA